MCPTNRTFNTPPPPLTSREYLLHLTPLPFPGVGNLMIFVLSVLGNLARQRFHVSSVCQSNNTQVIRSLLGTGTKYESSSIQFIHFLNKSPVCLFYDLHKCLRLHFTPLIQIDKTLIFSINSDFCGWCENVPLGYCVIQICQLFMILSLIDSLYIKQFNTVLYTQTCLLSQV